MRVQEDAVVRMRVRIEQLRKILSFAHDPRIVDAIQRVIAAGEADIRKLETRRTPGHDKDSC